MRGARRGGILPAAAGPRRRAAALVACLAPCASPLAAQQPGTYVEHAVTRVTVESSGVEATRTLIRDGRHEVTRRGDTLVVLVTELELRTQTGDEVVRHDTDGFVGGRWKLLADRHGGWRTVESPFVPAALEEVSDLGQLMAGFFPPTPPTGLPVGDTLTAADRVIWERLPGDGVHAVHAWQLDRTTDTTRALADSLVAVVHEASRERGEGQWAVDGVVAWSRTVETTSETTVAGRVVRARVRQETGVIRQP